MKLCSCKVLKVLKLTCVYHQNLLQWSHKHQNWATKRCKNVVWFDELMAGWADAGDDFPKEKRNVKRDAARKKASRYRHCKAVLLGNLGFCHSCWCCFDTYLLPDHCYSPSYTPSWRQCFLMAVASFDYPDTLQILFRNGLSNMTEFAVLKKSLQTLPPNFQISIRPSVYGMCWRNKSDPWKPDLKTHNWWCYK